MKDKRIQTYSKKHKILNESNAFYLKILFNNSNICFEEFNSLLSKIDELQDYCLEELLPKGKHDNCSEITLEVRSGAGGSESSLFAEEIFLMYQAYL